MNGTITMEILQSAQTLLGCVSDTGTAKVVVSGLSYVMHGTVGPFACRSMCHCFRIQIFCEESLAETIIVSLQDGLFGVYGSLLWRR